MFNQIYRLNESMFSRDDMEEFSDFLQSQCHSQITQDISVLINMSALAINSLLESSQEQGATVELDTTALENQGLLDRLGIKLSLSSWSYYFVNFAFWARAALSA